MSAPRLSMVMIAKDEEEHVEACFESWWDVVDEAVLCDTGSTDHTIAAARAFALRRGEPKKLIVGQFEWCDNFAAARNYADSLASGDWLGNCDLDERIEGFHHVRPLLTDAQPGAGTFMIADVGDGQLTGGVRPLINRAGFRWVDRLHEMPYHPAGSKPWTVRVDPGLCRRVHTSFAAGGSVRTGSLERNLRIAERWAAEEPDNGRSVFHAAGTLYLLGRVDEAKQTAIDGLKRQPVYVELYSFLATIAQRQGDIEGAMRWAFEGLNTRGVVHPGLTRERLILALAELAREHAASQRSSRAQEAAPRGPGGAVLLGSA